MNREMYEDAATLEELDVNKKFGAPTTSKNYLPCEVN
jgi:hypothetical protein